MIALLVIIVLVLLVFAWWWVVQPHGRDALGRDAQLPLFSARSPGSSLRVVGVGARREDEAVTPRTIQPPASPRRPGSNGTAATPEIVTPLAASAPPSAPPSAPRPSARPSPATGGRPPIVSPAAPAPSLAADAPAAEELKWAPPTRSAPTNGTVEFLPGRLDVAQGRGVAGQEVRFVRPSRPGERAVVTFGRGEGPLYRHVQLNVPTVSRLHARLSLYADTGGWAVENLSSTNPTVLNGEELVVGAPPRPLREGDRLEMGEVVFTYHAR